jgi:hypothetical protein
VCSIPSSRSQFFRLHTKVLPIRPNSLFTNLLQVSLGLPILLSLWGVHCKAYFYMAPSGFLKVCPIHFNLRFLISIWIGSWFVSFHRSLLDILTDHQIARMCRKQRLMKVWSGLVTVLVTIQVLLPYSKTDFTFVFKSCIFVPLERFFYFSISDTIEQTHY